MDNIKVSIVTVCYNSEATIEKTILSVLNQTYANVEYIVIDGLSSDSTLNIVKKYESKFQGRLKVISEKDMGIYDAMNKGIEIATGSMVGIINSDDYYENNAVEKVVEKYNGEKYCVLYGMIRTIDDDNEKSIEWFSHNFIHEKMIAHPACFVSKEAYMRFGKYDVHHYSAADYDLMLRYYDCGEVMFIPIYNILANHTVGGISCSTRGYLDAMKVRKEHGLMSARVYIISYVNTIIREKILGYIKR